MKPVLSNWQGGDIYTNTYTYTYACNETLKQYNLSLFLFHHHQKRSPHRLNCLHQIFTYIPQVYHETIQPILFSSQTQLFTLSRLPLSEFSVKPLILLFRFDVGIPKIPLRALKDTTLLLQTTFNSSTLTCCISILNHYLSHMIPASPSVSLLFRSLMTIRRY